MLSAKKLSEIKRFCQYIRTSEGEQTFGEILISRLQGFFQKAVVNNFGIFSTPLLKSLFRNAAA